MEPRFSLSALLTITMSASKLADGPGLAEPDKGRAEASSERGLAHGTSHFNSGILPLPTP